MGYHSGNIFFFGQLLTHVMLLALPHLGLFSPPPFASGFTFLFVSADQFKTSSINGYISPGCHSLPFSLPAYLQFQKPWCFRITLMRFLLVEIHRLFVRVFQALSHPPFPTFSPPIRNLPGFPSRPHFPYFFLPLLTTPKRGVNSSWTVRPWPPLNVFSIAV